MFADLPMPPTFEVLGIFVLGSLVSMLAIAVASFLLFWRLTGRKPLAVVLCVPVLCLAAVGLYFIHDNLPPGPRPPRPQIGSREFDWK